MGFPEALYTQVQKGHRRPRPADPPAARLRAARRPSALRAGQAASAGCFILSTSDVALGLLASLQLGTNLGTVQAWPFLIRNNFPLFNNAWVNSSVRGSQLLSTLQELSLLRPSRPGQHLSAAPSPSPPGLPLSHLIKPLREMISA